jgi:AcrR family transcriptional regulator
MNAAPGRRERKAAETRERIFRAAIELFAQRGLENVTVEQITDRADVGKGTFFNYFPNKEGVLTYFGGNQVERLKVALARGEIRGTAAERIRQVHQVLATYPDMTPELARGLFIACLSDSAQLDRPSIWQIQEILEKMVRDGQEQGEFRTDLTAGDAALFIFGQYFLGLLAWCTGFGERSLPEIVADYVSNGLYGIATRA